MSVRERHDEYMARRIKEEKVANNLKNLKDKLATEKQVGGDHYKDFTIQPVVFIQENKLDFCEGNIIKYICRHKFKGGAKEVSQTKEMEEVVDYAKDMFFKLFNESLQVSVHNGHGASATFGGNGLNFFYNTLGKKWFDLENNKEKILSLLIHEFAHYIESDHLSKNFHDACCDIGAKWFMLNEKDSRLC